MSEAEVAKAAEATAAAEKAASDKAAAEATSDPAELLRQIATLNQENAERRTKANKLQAIIDKSKEASTAAEIKAAEETGEFKKLYEDLKATSETASASSATRITAMEATLGKMLEVEIANIPEAQRVVLDKFDNVSDKLDFIATARETGLFAQADGTPPKILGDEKGGTLEAQYAEAEKAGNVSLMMQIKAAQQVKH